MPNPVTTESANPKPLVLRLLPLGILAIGFVAFFGFGLNRYLTLQMLADNQQWLTRAVAGNELTAALIYMAVYATSTAFSLPGGAILTLAGGFLFGTLAATGYVSVAATAGATTVFLVARFGFGEGLAARAGPFLKRVEAGFHNNAFSYLLSLRLIPIFPFWVVNLVPAFLGVSLRTYVVTTFIGILPGVWAFSRIGASLRDAFADGHVPDLHALVQPSTLAALSALALLSLAPVLWKKFKTNRAPG